MSIIYTENFLEEIERRNISEDRVEYLLQFIRPIGIEAFLDENDKFELHYPLDNSHNFVIIVKLFNLNQIILISAFPVIRKPSGIDLNGGDVRLRKFYDEVLDLMTLGIVGGFRYGLTVVVGGGIFIDFDSYGFPIAIEIFRFSKIFKLNPQILPTAKIEGTIVISDDLIKVKITATVRFKEVSVRSVEKEMKNLNKIPPNEFVLKIN